MKNIPGSVESNRVLEKAGWDPIIHTYKKNVAIEIYKIVKEEYEHRWGNTFRKSRIRERKLEVPRLN